MEKRILIVRRYKGFGGIEHQIKTISSELKSRGWSVFLLTDTNSPFSQSLMAEGVHVIIHPFGNMLCTAKIISSICRKEKIEIIQSHMLNEDFRCRIAKVTTPKVKHIFRVHTYIDCSNISESKKMIYHFLSRMTDSLVDMYISINDYNVHEMKKRTGIKEKKIKVIHDAVREFNTNTKDFSFKRSKHLAMIANFDPGKGHEIAVKAIKILHDKGEKYTLHIIGGVPGRGTDHEDDSVLLEIRELVEKYKLQDRIIFEGFCSEIETILDICDCVVLPSYSEGTPNCLLEGMILGKIVVSSCVGGVPEFVFDNETGFNYFPNSEVCLADKISSVYSKSDDELNHILRNAKRVVEQEYSRTVVGEELEVAYNSLMEF